MNEKQLQFLSLAKHYEQLKDSLSKVRDELDAAMKELGLDSYHQDPDTFAVYKIFKPSGTFTAFRDLDYKRTALEGEKGGGSGVLSKKEAEERGFVVKR